LEHQTGGNAEYRSIWSGAMKKRSDKKSNRGRKPNRAVLSGIKPAQETWDEIRCRIIFGSNEWPIVALRHWLRELTRNSDHRLETLWSRLIADFKRAVTGGDADWFRRQADAIEKGGSPQRAQFNAKVVLLLEQAWSETLKRLGRPENWRPLTDAEWEAFPDLPRVPHVVTLTPAGNFTDATARDIYNALEKRYLSKKGKENDENGPQVVEGYQFENRERVREAIHDLATRLQFELKKQAKQT
jgi:hypothetical protein